MEFKVETDEKYYSRYLELAIRVKSLGGLFQNPNTLTNEQSLIEWQEIADQLEAELSELIHEAQYRIKKIDN